VDPEGQLRPQLPQLRGLDPRSTQVPPQFVCPDEQGEMQAPPVQVAPAGQLFPHRPQCRCDDGSLTHAPSQTV
jgi:hypothetical protein